MRFDFGFEIFDGDGVGTQAVGFEEGDVGGVAGGWGGGLGGVVGLVAGLAFSGCHG